jgi:hypothetical protein
MAFSLRKFGALLGACALMAGCAYTGGDVTDPLSRKVYWFSFVAGDDIRAACRPGAPDRFRLVYNGVYGEQMRTYELDSAQKRLLVRVAKAPSASINLSLDDPMAHWRSAEATTQLDDQHYGQLVSALAADGAFGPPAVGTNLPSHGFYWAAATCKDGRFTFTGWAYPSDAFKALTFPGLLKGLDFTDQPFAEAHDLGFDPIWEQHRKRNEVVDFTLTVGRDGMVR